MSYFESIDVNPSTKLTDAVEITPYDIDCTRRDLNTVCTICRNQLFYKSTQDKISKNK